MSKPAYRYLLPMWDGGGTVAPELGVARRLIARGHSVHVLADPTIRHQAEDAGCTFTPWVQAPHRTSADPDQDLLHDWETANPLAMLGRVRDRFIAGPAEAFAADTAGVIEQVQPDVVARLPAVRLDHRCAVSPGAGRSDRPEHLDAAEPGRASDRSWVPAGQGLARSVS